MEGDERTERGEKKEEKGTRREGREMKSNPRGQQKDDE